MPKMILCSPSMDLISVVKQIRALYGDVKFITMHPEQERVYKDLELPYVPLGNYITEDVRNTAYKESARIILQTSCTRHNAPDLDPKVINWLDHDLPSFLYPRLPELTTLALALESAKPDLAIIHNDVEPMMRLIAQFCRSHNIPCLHVPHAIYHNDTYRILDGTDVHEIVTASDIAVAGPYQAQWYVERGGNVRLTGLPQWDKWAHVQYDTKFSRSLLGLDPSRPVVAFASSWRQDTNLLGMSDGIEEAYKAVIETIKAMPEVQFVIKLHPRANNGDWHAKLAKEANIDCVITALHLEIVLQASDVLLSYGPSNVVIEAAHLPHLRLLCTSGFLEDDEVITVDPKVPDLENDIRQCLAEGPINMLPFVYKYAGIPDGNASMRVANYALELLKV
jgi:hypothetical protein